MVKVLFDTNILIDYLNGMPAAKVEVERFTNPAISIITWMEVMVGTTPQNQAETKQFLTNFALLSIDAAIAERAVVLRQSKRIKLPDAIIWSTAQIYDRLLVTRNTKDFAENELGIIVPYQC
jgi:hypothetical protein